MTIGTLLTPGALTRSISTVTASILTGPTAAVPTVTAFTGCYKHR